MNSRRLFSRLLAGLLGSAFLVSASAQSFPHKIVNLVVPYPAGGPSDFVARQLQPELGKTLAQTVIVDNIGGVAGALGVQKMLAAAHDGHTLILGSPMELVLAPLAMSSVKHKPEDVKVVARVGTTHMVLLTRKDLPVNNIDELIALIKKPGAKSLSYGSVGPGSLYHLLGEKFALHTGTALLHIPYKGAAPLLTDLMGGQIDMVFMPLAGGTPGMIADGKVKAIGITSRTPHPRFPHLTPMAAQKSMAGFEYDLWVGLQVPAATPAEATLKLNKAIYEVLQNPSVRNNLESSGSLIGQPMDVAELARMYSAEIARYQAIAKSIQLQPQ